MANNTITTTGALIINGQQVENTLRNITTITRTLEAELRRLPVGTEEFRRKAEELRNARERFNEINTQVRQMSGALRESEGFLGRLTGGMLNFGNVFRNLLAYNLFEGLFRGVAGAADNLLKVADAMTDVEKTTNMATAEVKALWDGFDGINTRSEKIELLKIAEIGGRLGVPNAEMKDFVEQIDKAYVALGDSFQGGLDAVVTQLGKMKGLFNDTKDLDYGTAINKIGSALNALAAQGAGSESNISDFALRVGTLPDALKPSIDKVLGLGTAFEESGINAEIGASGFTKFMTTAAENIGQFAKSMHMSKQQAEDLINSKPEEFFLRFSQGMKGLSATETAKIFDSLKINTQEVQKAVGAAANDTARFAKDMAVAGEEMEKATSLTDEFNKKNNNAPAIVDKIKNAFSNLFTSTNALAFFEPIIKGFGWITGVSSEAGNGVKIFMERMVFLIKIVVVATTAMLSYKTAVYLVTLFTGQAWKQTLLWNVVQKAKNVYDTIAIAVMTLLAAAKAVYARNTALATQQMAYFNTACRANFIGALVAVVMAAVVAWKMFSDNVAKASEKQKLFNEIQKNAQDSYAEEESKIRSLYKIASDETLLRVQRNAALVELKKLMPGVLEGITLETIKTMQAKDAIDKYIGSLKKKAMMEAFQSKRTELMKEGNSIKAETQSDQSSILNLWGVGKHLAVWEDGSKNADFQAYLKLNNDKERKAFEKKLTATALTELNLWKTKMLENNSKLKMLDDQERDFLQNNKDVIPTAATKNGGPTNTDPGKTGKEKKEKKAAEDPKAGDIYVKALADKEKNNKELLKLEQELERELLENKEKYFCEDDIITQDKHLKELALLKLSYKNKNEMIKQENQGLLADIAKLEEQKTAALAKKSKIKDPKERAIVDQAMAEYNKSIVIKNNTIAINNQRELALTEEQIIKIRILKEKALVEDFERDARNEQRNLDLAREQDETELSNIQDLGQAKALLKQNQHLVLSAQELDEINSLEEAKKALREEADRKALLAQYQAFERQISAMQKVKENFKTIGATPEELKELDANISFLESKLASVKNQGKNNKSGDKDRKMSMRDNNFSKVDVLGFSALQWKESFKNMDTTAKKLKAVGMVFQAMANLGKEFAELQRNIGERELKRFEAQQDVKKKKLLEQLNNGQINNEEYHAQLRLMEEETAKKKAEIAYKQAVADRAFRIASTIANTAMGVAAALANSKTDPITSMVLAGLVGAMGALQLGIILSQPLPDPNTGYAEGGKTKGLGYKDKSGHEVAGVVHANEYVIPEWLRQEPEVARVEQWIEAKRTGKNVGFAEGGPTSTKSTSAPQIISQKSENNNQNLENTLSKLTEIMKNIETNGLDAYVIADEKNGKMMRKAIKNYETITNRNANK